MKNKLIAAAGITALTGAVGAYLVFGLDWTPKDDKLAAYQESFEKELMDIEARKEQFRQELLSIEAVTANEAVEIIGKTGVTEEGLKPSEEVAVDQDTTETASAPTEEKHETATSEAASSEQKDQSASATATADSEKASQMADTTSETSASGENTASEDTSQATETSGEETALVDDTEDELMIFDLEGTPMGDSENDEATGDEVKDDWVQAQIDEHREEIDNDDLVTGAEIYDKLDTDMLFDMAEDGLTDEEKAIAEAHMQEVLNPQEQQVARELYYKYVHLLD